MISPKKTKTQTNSHDFKKENGFFLLSSFRWANGGFTMDPATELYNIKHNMCTRRKVVFVCLMHFGWIFDMMM